jgi:hypothetical protein
LVLERMTPYEHLEVLSVCAPLVRMGRLWIEAAQLQRTAPNGGVVDPEF